MAAFNKILIANRGEIAVRIIRTAHALGYRTVAVFSEADTTAPHVELADEAICIGSAAVGDSYLNAEKILWAAQQTQADAIHPGYGFLSENAVFAQKCVDAGLVFIGPTPAAIELMGSKRLAKLAVEKFAVPCIPGYQGADQTDAVLINEIKRIGFPVMIKASAGGGGRGMRLLLDEKNLQEQIASARSEAQNAFGSGELILERAILKPRHIEIQIFADTHGNIVYLGERDCSVQRRHQKVVEEAPSPVVNAALRKQMGEAAVQAAKSANYIGAGTVEFLLDENGKFYFLEMNTRLQVEHPVTELITGQDLVSWQLKVAAGEPLPLKQDAIQLIGHAVEVRFYAEDPSKQFLPQTGYIHLWHAAEFPGIRIDHGVKQSNNVSANYDPMLAKIIAYGSDRIEAIRKLKRAVEETRLLGVKTNKAFLADILGHSEFIAGAATTAFIGEHMQNAPSLKPFEADPFYSAVAAIIFSHQPTKQSLFIRSNRALKLQINDATPFSIVIQALKENLYSIANEEFLILKMENNQIRFQYKNKIQRQFYALTENRLFFDTPNGQIEIENLTFLAPKKGETVGDGRITAPMDGAIIALLAEPEMSVEKGQTIAILEAMKIEHPLRATVSGKIKHIAIQPGQQVKNRQLLIQIDPQNE